MLYLDSSALVKCYANETAALDTVNLIDAAQMVATSPITRVEVASALARAVRGGLLPPHAGRQAYLTFVAEARALIQVPVTERILARAQELVWEAGLRGYDAIQLASAQTWADRLGRPVTVATFHRQLAEATRRTGLSAWPDVTGDCG